MDKKEPLWEAMAYVSPDLIEEADGPVRRRRPWGRTALIAAAACMALLIGAAAAENLFGFKLLDFTNDGEDNSYSLMAEDTVKFPRSMFGETAQDYIVNGMPILEEQEAESDGSAGDRAPAASVVTMDVPTFDRWEEAADFVGERIPLLPENKVLQESTHDNFTVWVHSNVVSIHTTYTVEGASLLFSADVEVEGSKGIPYGASYGEGDLTITPSHTVTGSGCDVLLYVTEGERPSSAAHFIADGIFYSLFLENGDADTMQEILNAY